MEVEMKEIKMEYENLFRENQTLKTKVLESGQELRKNYETRDL